MAVYVVVCQLKSDTKDYSGLKKELALIGDTINPFPPVLLISSSLSAFEIKDRLLERVDQLDNLLVVEVSNQIAGSHDHGRLTGDWIKNQIS